MGYLTLEAVAKWTGKNATKMPQACPLGFVARRNKAAQK